MSWRRQPKIQPTARLRGQASASRNCLEQRQHGPPVYPKESRRQVSHDVPASPSKDVSQSQRTRLSITPRLPGPPLEAASVRIERIVSHGHASPEGFWYDQDQSEFVVLLQSAARLRFEDGMIEMDPGSGDHRAGVAGIPRRLSGIARQVSSSACRAVGTVGDC